MCARPTVDAAPIQVRAKRFERALVHARPTATDSAAARQSAQLPGFAPLLEELEVAGWSSHRRALSGNFHDWLLLQQRTLLVIAGHATSTEAVDPIEAALVAQGAWAAIRSHAEHANDAGALLSLTAKTLWPVASTGVQAALALAIVDLDGGRASVAAAGDCLALKIRATGSEQITLHQPAIGANSEFIYTSQTVQLSLRDRIVLVADESWQRPAKLVARVTNSFARLDAESHRRMMAADAIGMVRDLYGEQVANDAQPSASIVAVRRR